MTEVSVLCRRIIMLNVVTNFLNTSACKVITVDHERRSVVQCEMLVSLVDPKGKSRTGHQSSDNLKVICCGCLPVELVRGMQVGSHVP